MSLTEDQVVLIKSLQHSPGPRLACLSSVLPVPAQQQSSELCYMASGGPGSGAVLVSLMQGPA